MSMSDEVAGATLQVSMKAGEMIINVAGNAINHTIDNIAKLLQALAAKSAARAAAKDNNILKSTDLTDIKPGEVKIGELRNNAKKNGDQMVGSDNGFTLEDKKILAQKAKDYGIPIAFQNEKGKDNYYANVRQSDLPIFKRMCTELMKDKLAERPQEFGNFKCKEWEIPFITKELNKYDLPAQFGKTENGEHFCLYDKSAEKTMLMARGIFVQKCKEVNENVMFDKDENGYYTIKDLKSGKEISFDNVPSKGELSRQINEKFGYKDENKADIACARFGEEMLQGEEKQKFFSSDPQNEFSKVEGNIEIEGEDLLTKDYTCWRLTPKTDDVPKIVYRDKEGNFAVLNPEKMTRAQMSEELEKALNITDKQTLDALVDKAEKVNDYYTKQADENYIYSKQFTKDDFDMTDQEVISNMYRTDENGNTYAKKLPVDSVDCELERMDKDSFKVTSTVQSIETGADGHNINHIDNQVLVLSFSDKKNAINEMTELLKKQGVPESHAKQIAKENFKRAENQSAEKVVQLEEIRGNVPYYGENSTLEMDIKCGNKKETISVSDSEKAKKEIAEKFEVSEAAAAAVMDKADEKLTDKQMKKLEEFGFQNTDKWTKEEASDVIHQLDDNGWKVPDNIDPATYVPGQGDSVGGAADSVAADLKPLDNKVGDININAANNIPDVKVSEMPKLDIPAGRRM